MKIPHERGTEQQLMHTRHDEASEVSRYFAMLAESMPCPVVQFGGDGRVVIANARADLLVSRSAPDGTPRVLLADGGDFWQALCAEAAIGGSLLDGSAKVRLSDGAAALIWYAGFPAATQAGALTGAVVLVYDASDERLAGGRPSSALPVEPRTFARAARELAEAAGAGSVFIAEIEPDRPRLSRTLAAIIEGEERPDRDWDLGTSPAPIAPAKPIVVVRDGLAERFSDDPVATGHGYRAFAGALLLDEEGERIGVIGAYFAHPIEREPAVRGMLRLFAATVAPSIAALKAQRALCESEERYAAMFAHGHMPIVLIEPDSTQIVEANRAACVLYGLDERELTTMSFLQLAAESPEALHTDLRAVARGHRDYFIARQVVAGGEVRDVEVFAGPLSMGGRTLVYAVLHDITEKRRAEAEVARYRRELETVVQRRTADLLDATSALEQERERRSRLYRDMGHQVRTPLQTILGFSEALASGLAGELSAEQMRQVAMIGEAAKRLNELVDDILELTRLESGAVDLRLEPFDLRQLAESVAVSVQAEASTKGLSVRTEVPGEPVGVETDRTKVEQILAELLANALKYTETGGITVRVVGPTGGQVAVEVADTGVGISPESLPHVFEEFRHLREGEGGAHVGTGLGLALCKRLAQTIGGRIEVESTRGKGSTFRVWFPVRYEAGA
ncbi:PAS domain-containing sensor histidine kinase [Coriobacteriia bacterium Es71-Z0120]|uniref:sensor histidine kinase n=1 Tax=Parvivirga hydrogeniphila TaxID=2939460 RepID=UPI002260E00F|nr:PAS domain-containing sensor histidine kinase [Parvivirga hydrogeniphila]MCL4078212.1 PAS domain-containing sensor histidine kinase [Parvivirga hydrogeniphila]